MSDEMSQTKCCFRQHVFLLLLISCLFASVQVFAGPCRLCGHELERSDVHCPRCGCEQLGWFYGMGGAGVQVALPEPVRLLVRRVESKPGTEKVESICSCYSELVGSIPSCMATQYPWKTYSVLLRFMAMRLLAMKLFPEVVIDFRSIFEFYLENIQRALVRAACRGLAQYCFRRQEEGGMLFSQELGLKPQVSLYNKLLRATGSNRGLLIGTSGSSGSSINLDTVLSVDSLLQGSAGSSEAECIQQITNLLMPSAATASNLQSNELTLTGQFSQFQSINIEGESTAQSVLTAIIPNTLTPGFILQDGNGQDLMVIVNMGDHQYAVAFGLHLYMNLNQGRLSWFITQLMAKPPSRGPNTRRR